MPDDDHLDEVPSSQPADLARRRARVRWIAAGVFAALVVGTVGISVAGATRHQIPVFATAPAASTTTTVATATTQPPLTGETHARLGITVGPTDPRVLQADYGSPAASVGIAPGDVIMAVAGTPVATSAALATALEHAPADAHISLTWKDADGVQHTATVALATP